mgnify:CR=1 FL=1
MKIMRTESFTRDLINVQNDLLRFAYKLTANHEDANDLLQETSLKALDNEEKYAAETNFKGWMYTIMRNLFINNYRKAVRDQTYVDQTDNLFYLNQSIDLADESTESSHDLKEIRRVVNALPKEYDTALAACREITARGDCLTVGALALDGRALVALGLRGRQIGAAQAY